MTPLLATYIVYLTISGFITFVVGSRLHRHGRPFLIDVFRGRVRIADAVNHMLLVGYYLVNFAFVALMLRSGGQVQTWEAGLHLVAHKLGIVMGTLGAMHFFNVAVLLCIRRRVWDAPMDVVEFVRQDV